MSIDDLKAMADRYGSQYSKEELIIVYNYIKENYQDLLDGNMESLKKLRQKINPKLYNQLFSAYVSLAPKYL